MSKELKVRNQLINQLKKEYPGNPNIELAVDKALDYKSDEFFKYVLTHSNHIRNIMCQYILPANIKLKETHIIDTHLYKQNTHDKPSVVDIAAVDDLGNTYDIEMQCYNITSSDFKRFQYYAYKSIGHQLDIKDDYKKLKPVYQLIINGSGKDALHLNHFEYHFETYDKYHHISLPHSLYYTSYIQLHHKDEIENKESLNSFLELMLTFQSNGNTDIIETEIIKELKLMYDDYTRTAEAIRAAHEEIDRMYWDVKMDDFREEALEKGMKEGIEKGMQQGIEQGKESTTIEMIQSLMSSLNCDCSHAMDLLKISNQDQKKYKELL